MLDEAYWAPKISLLAVESSGCGAAWLAHLLWEQGVVSSNLTSPTTQKLVASATSFLLFAAPVAGDLALSEQVEQLDLDAAVELAALVGVVRSNRAEFAHTNGAQPGPIDASTNEIANNRFGSSL